MEFKESSLLTLWHKIITVGPTIITLHEFTVPGLIFELHYICSVCLNYLIIALHVGALILVLSIDVFKNYITFCGRGGNIKKLHYIFGPQRN